MSWDFETKKIISEKIQLEPLEEISINEICQSLIPDPKGWYSIMFGLNTPEAYEKEIKDSIEYRKKKYGMGFAIRDLSSSEIAGITFFLRMDEENRSLEIGTTNISPKYRRTYINTAAKFALLKLAFETYGCIRVSFRVDEENVISRTAVERIGAKYGGTLRYERILPDGRIRNYCFYSIIDIEWPAIKQQLLSILHRS